MLESLNIMDADSLAQHSFIEDHHRVKILHSLRQFVFQLIEVQVELLTLESFANADQGLKLSDDHNLLLLATHPDDRLNVLFVDNSRVDQLVS